MKNLLNFELYEKFSHINFAEGSVEKLAKEIMEVAKGNKKTAYHFITITKNTLGSEADLDYWEQAKDYIMNFVS